MVQNLEKMNFLRRPGRKKHVLDNIMTTDERQKLVALIDPILINVYRFYCEIKTDTVMVLWNLLFNLNMKAI